MLQPEWVDSSDTDGCCSAEAPVRDASASDCILGDSKRRFPFLLVLGSALRSRSCCCCCDSCSLSLLSNGAAGTVWDSVEGGIDGDMFAMEAKLLDTFTSPSNACSAAEHRGATWTGPESHSIRVSSGQTLVYQTFVCREPERHVIRYIPVYIWWLSMDEQSCFEASMRNRIAVTFLANHVICSPRRAPLARGSLDAIIYREG